MTWPAPGSAAAVRRYHPVWQPGQGSIAAAAGADLPMHQSHEAHLAVRRLHVGWLVAEVRRRLDDPPVETVLSVVTGYRGVDAGERDLSGRE